MQKWLTIIGIGEDGIDGLSAIARSVLNQANIIMGGKRHLQMISDILPNDHRQIIPWKSPFDDSIQDIIKLRGQSICILASGDPMCYGIGSTIIKYIPIDEITIIPHLSAFSLACSRLGWSFTDVEYLSLCGRPLDTINYHIYPHAKLLVLSSGKNTPRDIAQVLTSRGYGNSKITVLQNLGGSNECIISDLAANCSKTEIAVLNIVAVECIANLGISGFSRFPGLPDNAFIHDGQLTKREIRSVTLSSLAPLPGQLLWDVGAGCGSISIEWMRSNTRCQAIAIEQNPTRINYIVNNANNLGTPNLQIIAGKVPEILPTLQNLPQPDAVFIGGGVTASGVLEFCWNALRNGGKMVVNVVTLEGEKRLYEWYEQVGGDFIKIGIQRGEPIGKFLGWKSMSCVTQWVGIKQ
ncbi:precorrin-6y C5,15-methyltransferase (decarboxylating) subunit CbiE [Anabaena sp. FACHB-1237]|uniref:precorrin-6y C5,15-methyltransferase (decarboxylating) subunit CbiE n=1 Tax=Anabaena sp. FACHB-1237 TaxID=2692769 RepID=UPI0016804DF0|nr:precorrin-6y C5,15-methyltransferase (decarboxylating) subunit CbiE [Anabaena sp. FACHB-1237]MBD2139254.1 precorrin-6y C5,15-methyltransferase (decarboxylating) subunit CbiE [Anabaena sp. FACHB-1237]